MPSPIPIEGFLGDDQDAVDTMPSSLLRDMPHGFTDIAMLVGMPCRSYGDSVVCPWKLCCRWRDLSLVCSGGRLRVRGAGIR